MASSKPAPRLSAHPALIGLGLACLAVSAFCDNLRSPLLPVLGARFGAGPERLATFLTVGSLAGFAFSLASVEALKRMSEVRFLHLSSLILSAALVLLLWGHVSAFYFASALLWGAGIVGVGMTSNLFVIAGSPEKTRGMWLSLLHFTYAVVSTLPGLYVAHSLTRSWSFSTTVLAAPLSIVAALVVAGFIWGGDASHRAIDDGKHSWRELLDRRTLLFATGHSSYVLGEVLTAIWLPSFLHAEHAFSMADAGRYSTYFFVGLCVGRLCAPFLLRILKERTLLLSGLFFSAVFAAFGLKIHPLFFAASAFAMGPAFPLLISLLSRNEPRRYRAVLALSFSGISLTLALGHALFGKVSQAMGMAASFYAPPVFLLVSVLLLARWCESSPAPADP